MSQLWRVAWLVFLGVGNSMCGIAGICAFSRVEPRRIQANLDRAIRVMRNRGPSSSGQGFWESQTGATVALASTRLAVLDLSEVGSQPMNSADGRYQMVFNGEITNYLELREELKSHGMAFQSTGDSEVLLRSWEFWGPECLQRLEGMYAFGMLDRRLATLSLCRDPFGIKPLFIGALGHEGIAFGSEIASVLPFFAARPKLNWTVATQYLASGDYDDDQDSFIEKIKHLQPGSMMEIDLRSGQRRSAIAKWWPSIETDESLTLQHASRGVRDLLSASVERNLRSDVPVGFALSGGIDSSAIVHLAQQVMPGLEPRTFSFVSPGSAVDESRWVQVARENLGGSWEQVAPQSTDLIEDLDDVILCQGEPFSSTSIYAQYRVFQLMHESGIVVSLDGQGGDEVFAGYVGYPGQRSQSLVEAGQFLQAANFLWNWSKWPDRSLLKGIGWSAFEILPKKLADTLYARSFSSPQTGVMKEKFGTGIASWAAQRHKAEVGRLSGVRVKAELRESLLQRGLVRLLRHGDRNSMRWSVESRVPFLDRELITFVLSLPEHFLIDGRGTTKKVLREALRGVVPQAVLDRRDKIGFETSQRAWLDAHRRHFADLVLNSPTIGFLDSSVVAKGIAGDSSVPRIGSSQAWRFINLYRWVALMGIDSQ